MRLTACGCRAEHYRRTMRAWWMRAIWTRRLYHCYACDAELLISPVRVTERLQQRPRADRRARSAMALKGS